MIMGLFQRLMPMAKLHLPHSTVTLLLSHVPVDVVARNIQLILWKVCLLALCLLNTEDVWVLTFDVFHTSILKKRDKTIDSTPNSFLLLKAIILCITLSQARIPFTFHELIFFVQGLIQKTQRNLSYLITVTWD